MSGPRDPSIALDAEVLLAHSAWLTRLARALVVSDDEIDDVVQQTYLQALAKPPRHTENLRAWLAAIARNIVRSKSRSDMSRVAREVAVAPPPPIDDPAEAVERAELRQIVVESVLALDEPYRSSLILRFFEEMDVDAIGRMMGSGGDTVRTRIRRGIIRVREQLERHVLDTSRDSTDGGAAALAVLFARLRRIAAGSGSAGSVGAPIVGRAGELRSAARSKAMANVPRVLVATAIIAAATGLWWRVRQPAPIHPETRTAEAARTSVPSTHPASASDAVERKDETSPAIEERQPTVVQPPPTARVGTIRGVVSDPSGSPLAGASVWALLCTSHREEYSISDFAGAASDELKFEAEGRTLGNWVRTTSGIDGRYEVTGLSMMPGWQVGVFSPDVGAGLADVQSFDHDHRDLMVDVKLAPGTVLKGMVRDDDGHPIGNALVLLYTTLGKQVKQETIVATASGLSVGEYKIDFRCGDLLELECRAPGFDWAPRSRINLTAKANETTVDFSLKRRPGNVVRGRIVDPAGHPLDLLAMLAERFPAVKTNARPFKVSVDAIPSSLDAATRRGPDRLPEGAVEGRVDYVAGVYEVILPDGFTGSLELRIAHAVVGSIALLGLERPPDLPCNADLVPGPATSKPFAIRYVDAESGLGIDLERELAPPRGNDGSYVAARPRSDSDLRHGLVIYSCASGFLKIEVGITGYAPGLFFFNVPDGPQLEPLTLRVPRAQAGVRGTVLHSDGMHYSKTPITVFRRDREQWINAGGGNIRVNPDGEFELTNLARCEHVIVVSGWPDEAPGVVRFDASDPFPVIEVRTIVTEPTRFHLIGKPPAGKDLRTYFRIFSTDELPLESLDGDRNLRECKTDDASVPLVNGRYMLLVERDGYRERRIDFDVPAGDTIVVPLEPDVSQSK